MGIGAWIAVIVVAVIFVCSLAYLIYKKVTGKGGGCDCGCDCCPHCSHCGTQKDAAAKEPSDDKK